MAEQPVKVELYYSGAWQDVTAETRQNGSINYQRGLANESLESQPGTASLVFDNRAGKYNPNNPASPLYGLVGRNTPLRLSLDGDVLWSGEVAAWKPRRTTETVTSTRGDAWTGTTGAGILRRLGRGKTPLRSALTRSILADSPDRYWPMDDGRGANAAASALPEGFSIPGIPNPAFADWDGPGGASPKLVTLVKDTVEVGGFSFRPEMTNTDYWEMEFVVSGDIDMDDPTARRTFMFFETTGTNRNYWVEIARGDVAGQVKIEVWYQYSPTNQRGWDVDVDPADWYHVRVKLRLSGGNQLLSLYVNGESLIDGDDPAAAVGTFEFITVGPDVDQRQPAVGVSRVSIGHLALYSATATDHYAASTGYLGELAGTRFLRLADEEGIPAAVIGTSTDTQPMGPQPVGTVVDLLTECARTDAGMLLESKTAASLTLRTGRDLLNQTSTMALTYSQLAPPLEPVVGDQGTRNDVTATRPSGASARVTLDTGPMSTLDPPNGVGRYDTTISVNPSLDSRLTQHAGWALHLGTVDVTQYQTVRIDLVAQPSLADDVASLEIGDIVTITGIPAADDPNTATLMVTSIAETIGTHQRMVTLSTVPGTPYTVAVLDTSGYLDCDGTTTNEALDTTETGVDVLITDVCTWTHADGNYNVLIGGELMTVTAVGAVGGTAGALTQTLTVARSVNGVVKTHATGAAVHVADPFILAL